MAEEQPSGERTEAPTAKRRDDFRKKGQVAQSKEVQTAALFTLMLLFWLFFAPHFWESVRELMTAIWRNSGEYAITAPSLMHLAHYLVGAMAKILFPLFLVALVTGFFASLFQIGWLLTAKPLIPDFAKLDPIKGMGRFFSKRSLLEVVKSLLKVGLIGWIAFSTVAGEFDKALLLTGMEVDETVRYLARTAALVMAKVAALMIFLAALDFAFVRWEMEEKMKMTKQQQKEEMKETEGDPHIKSKIRSIQQQMARRRMMAAVPGCRCRHHQPHPYRRCHQIRTRQDGSPCASGQRPGTGGGKNPGNRPGTQHPPGRKPACGKIIASKGGYRAVYPRGNV
jgi:flagellar biosynthesis protein FlhB